MIENTQILDDIRSIMEQNLVLREQLQTLIEQARAHKENAIKLGLEHTQKLSDLETREKVTVEKERKILSAEALEEQQRLVEEGFAKIENSRLECDRECAEKRGVIANELAELASKLKDFEMREKALEEDRKTYKEKLLRKMGKDPS